MPTYNIVTDVIIVIFNYIHFATTVISKEYYFHLYLLKQFDIFSQKNIAIHKGTCWIHLKNSKALDQRFGLTSVDLFCFDVLWLMIFQVYIRYEFWQCINYIYNTFTCFTRLVLRRNTVTSQFNRYIWGRMIWLFLIYSLLSYKSKIFEVILDTLQSLIIV